MMPIVLRHAISGIALINTEDPLLEDPLALATLIDVFPTWLHATWTSIASTCPCGSTPPQERSQCRIKKVYRTQIRFKARKSTRLTSAGSKYRAKRIRLARVAAAEC